MNSAMALKDFTKTQTFWAQHREASLNWLALGLLLAAWNAADDSAARGSERPECLRGYSCVSVRAAQRIVWTSHKSVNVL